MILEMWSSLIQVGHTNASSRGSATISININKSDAGSYSEDSDSFKIEVHVDARLYMDHFIIDATR